MGGVVLGVDGGNSKTEYLLFTTNGDFVDYLRGGSCSHERFPDGYAGAKRVMHDNITALLDRNALDIGDVESAAFGLAGLDIPVQKRTLEGIIRAFGFRRFVCDNDAFLGVKAGSPSGWGVCSINGSGMVAGGIGVDGERLQVGGIGEIVGDESGGYFLARRAVRAVYDSLYRQSAPTGMADHVMALLQTDKRHYMEAVSLHLTSRTLPELEIMRCLFAEADRGDEVAVTIVKNSALQLAKSTAGCIENLKFHEDVPVILAGSVWVKAETDLLFMEYQKDMARLTQKVCHYVKLLVPPATGAVLWALELYYGKSIGEETRRRVIENVAEQMKR